MNHPELFKSSPHSPHPAQGDYCTNFELGRKRKIENFSLPTQFKICGKGLARENPLCCLLWHNHFEYLGCNGQSCGPVVASGVVHRVTINLHRDRAARAYLDECTGFIAHPLAPLLAVQQEVQGHEKPSQHTLLAYHTDIDQPIIALRQPCILECARVEPRIADDDLQRVRLKSMPIHRYRGPERWIAQTKPCSNQ